VAEKYFITGATGLVGSYITRKLISEGKEVYALKRKNSSLTLLEGHNNKIQWVEGDILDVSLLYAMLKDMDYAIHAAAFVSMRPKDKDTVFKINIEGTANMVNAALEANLKKFCFVSSIAALGVPEKATSIDEKATWNDDEKDFIYSKSKHYAEREVWRGIAEGLNAFIVNPSTVLGLSPLDKSSGQIINYVSKGINYYPQGKINLVSAEDIANIVFQLLHTGVQGERFILNAGSMTYKDFFALISKNFGKSAPQKMLKTNMLKIYYYFSCFLDLFGLGLGLSKEIISAAQSTHTYSSEKIIKQLQFQFEDLETTIHRVCQVYQNNMPHL
jgi:dihydroflavonol-4-reductase